MKDETLSVAVQNGNTLSGFSRLPSSSRRPASGWRLIPFLGAALVLIPIGTVLSSFFAPASDIWQHLVETTLPGLLVNTFWLALGVSAAPRCWA